MIGQDTAGGNRRYRILHSVADLHVGGVARLVLRNIAAMDPRRFENVVCYLAPRRDLEPEYLEAGVAPVCLDHQGKRHALRTLLRLIRLLKQERIDLVHTNHALDRLYLGLAAAICNVPVVTTLHSTTVPSELNCSGWPLLRARALAALEDMSARMLTRRFVAISEAVKRVATRYRRVPADRVGVLYSGVPIDDFPRECPPHEQSRLREELGVGQCYPILMNVGRLTHVKGQVHLVRMMPRVLERWPNAKLVIVGEGAERNTLQEEIARRGLASSIIMPGQRHDVAALLSMSDVFVFPSEGEGLGLALLEAAAVGKPVVATSSGAVPEVVEDGVSGYLVEPGNHDALADAVMRVIESADRSRTMGLRGQQIAKQKFDVRTSVRKLERVYLSVLKGPAAA